MVPNGKGECDGGGGGGNASPEGATGRKLKKGPWTAAEDAILVEHVRKYGEGNWNSVQRNSRLARCGKSCRLRWANHLRPDLKKGSFTPEEERLILELHAKYGNKWARMAAQIPGRTDNEIKNFWNTRMKRRLRQGLPLYPQEIQNTLLPNHRALTPLSPATPTISLASPHHHFSPQLLSPQQSYHSPTLSFPSHLNHRHQPLPVSHSPPILHPPLYRFGRLRNTVATTTHPIASPVPSPSPIMASPLSTPLSQFSTPQLSPMNFEAKSPPPTIQTQFKVDDFMFDDSSFAVKSEIPSNQPFQAWHLDAASDSAPGVNSGECGYLVERLEGHHAMVRDNALKRGDLEKQHAGDGFGSLYCTNSSSHYCPPSSENDSTEAPIDMIDLKHEDLSEFFTTLPLSTLAVDWFGNAASGQSNEQSSVVIDDAGSSIKMQEQLSSPFLIADSLETASCYWSHMPQIH